MPGWGYQLAPDTVLRQMRELGVRATEFGPEGFLPDAPADKAATLADVFGPERDPRRWPAQLAVRPGVTWILDEAAASGSPRR